MGSIRFFLLNQPKRSAEQCCCSRASDTSFSFLGEFACTAGFDFGLFALASVRLFGTVGSELARWPRRAIHQSHSRCRKPKRIVAHSLAVLKVKVVAR